MKRRLFNLATVVSLVMMLAAMAALSYRRALSLGFDSHYLCRRFELWHSRGIIFFSWVEIAPTASQEWQPTIAVELDSLVLGFGFYAAPGELTRAGKLAIPYWATILSVVGGLVTLRYLRQRRGQQKGRCPVCGYDLRATPERCPECGTAAGTPAAAGEARRA